MNYKYDVEIDNTSIDWNPEIVALAEGDLDKVANDFAESCGEDGLEGCSNDNVFKRYVFNL